MSAKARKRGQDPRQKTDVKVISAPSTRRRRALTVQHFVLGASVAFIALAVAARFTPYFPLDLRITRAVQIDQGIFFDRLMSGLSWLGFFPQVVVLGAVTVLLLYLLGLRWEAIATAFAACGVVIGTIVKLIVLRPRPTADLVQVVREMSSTSFPSGHVLTFTVFCGFLAFLVFTLLKSSSQRTLAVCSLSLLVALMGVSRIYLGHHWFSDVMGAYVLGSLWLALAIKFYRWGKPRFFVDQPVAPDTDGARTEARA